MRDGTAAHAFHLTLLREYDIRGIVGSTLHEADAGDRPRLRHHGRGRRGPRVRLATTVG